MYILYPFTYLNILNSWEYINLLACLLIQEMVNHKQQIWQGVWHSRKHSVSVSVITSVDTGLYESDDFLHLSFLPLVLLSIISSENTSQYESDDLRLLFSLLYPKSKLIRITYSSWHWRFLMLTVITPNYS